MPSTCMISYSLTWKQTEVIAKYFNVLGWLSLDFRSLFDFSCILYSIQASYITFLSKTVCKNLNRNMFIIRCNAKPTAHVALSRMH